VVLSRVCGWPLKKEGTQKRKASHTPKKEGNSRLCLKLQQTQLNKKSAHSSNKIRKTRHMTQTQHNTKLPINKQIQINKIKKTRHMTQDMTETQQNKGSSPQQTNRNNNKNFTKLHKHNTVNYFPINKQVEI
jgi:hypothetical protein